MSATRIPACAESMGCLCAGHARGNSADLPCDTTEESREVQGSYYNAPPTGPRKKWRVRVWLPREGGHVAPADSWPMTRERAESLCKWLRGEPQGGPCLVGPVRAEILKVGS